MKLTGTLRDETISQMISAAEREMVRSGVHKDDRLRVRLSIEELLLDYRETLGADAAAVLQVNGKRAKLKLTLEVSGPELDALSCPNSLILIKLLHGWKNAPVWEYRSGKNRILYEIKLHNLFTDNLRFTWNYTKTYKGYLFLAVALQMINVGLMILSPVLGARIIVHFTDRAIDQLFLTAILLFLTNLTSAVVLAGCNWAYNVVYNKTLTDLEKDVSEKTLRITNSEIDKHGTGLFIQRLTTDTANLATAIGTMADNLAQAFQYVGILVAILLISPSIFLITAVLLGAQIAIELKREKMTEKNDRIFRNANERYTSIIGEIVHGSRDIKLIHAEAAMERELENRIEEANSTRMHRDAVSRGYKLFGGGVREVAALLFVGVLALYLADGQLALASVLVLFNYYTSLGMPAITLLGTVLDFIANFNLSSERLSELVNDKVFAKETFGPLSKSDISGAVRFEQVYFSYNVSSLTESTRWVLSDLNFAIAPGETVALVGRSGSGKTTTFNLLTKLYTPFSGKILIDGIDIMELDRDSLRGSMSVVTQYPYIFNFSIRDNLRLAKPDMTEEEMRHAAELACIDEDIEAMPEKYDTIVGEGGVNLSGGQRQRLAIARSLLRQSKILLLDEATSALDNITQAKIKEALRRIHGRCTVLMIAHRLSTVNGADRILFLQDGQILAQGTHGELMHSCEAYKELYETETQ